MTNPYRSRYPGEEDDVDESPRGRCPHCDSRDPQIRTQHHLQILRGSSLDTRREHLTMQYVTLRDARKQRQDQVDWICDWAANLMEQFSHMVDGATGAPLSWWEARQYMAEHKNAIASHAY